jgi:o-succinylbenzoate---CoA ligase
VRVVEVGGDVGELTAALRDALDGGPAVLPLGAADPRRDELRARLEPGGPEPDGTALVVATSGSTGAAKGVVLSAAALRVSAAATHTRLGGPGRWLLALPGQHVAGIQVIVRSLLAGTEPAVLTGPFRPAAFAAAVPAERPRYTSLVPTQLSRLLAGPPDGIEALRAFDAVLLGGAAAPAPLLEQARATGARIVTTYGMSETAGGCVYDGRPLDGVRVRLTDGVVELSGPTLASGYRNDPDATAAAFTGAWFRTNDLGIVEDGLLTIHGRADFMINTGGVKVAPAAVEAVLAAQPGVADSCVVDLPDADWGQRVAAAVVPADPAAPPATGTLQAAVRAALGPPAVPRVVTFTATLPLLESGKVDRREVRRNLRS